MAFKVGDKVRVHCNLHSHGIPIGYDVTLTANYGSLYGGQYLQNYNSCYVGADEIILVEKGEIVELFEGDEVEILNGDYAVTGIPEKYIIHGDTPSSGLRGLIKWKSTVEQDYKFAVEYTTGGRTMCLGFREGGLKLIKSNHKKSFMSTIKETIKLAIKGEPEKSNITAGLRTINDEFTAEGKDAFLEFLYEKNKVDFKKEVADVIIESQKKK